MNALRPDQIVRDALSGTGLNLVASCSIEAYDARAPAAFASRALLPSARGVVVAGSAGRELWEGVRASGAGGSDPIDDYVSSRLAIADAELAKAAVTFRRFEARLGARPALDFRALGELVGLGSMGPFGLLIHEEHGPWWALRGAYLVDRAVAPPQVHRPPCVGCSAPCVGGSGETQGRGIALATLEVRRRCVVGHASSYSDEQLAHHYPPRHES